MHMEMQTRIGIMIVGCMGYFIIQMSKLGKRWVAWLFAFNIGSEMQNIAPVEKYVIQ